MMDTNLLTFAAFTLVCLFLLTLPFVPAVSEWLYPTDALALPISANYTADIDHFAKRLRADVAAKLGQGAATGYEDFDFVASPVDSMDWSKASKRLISRSSVAVTTPVRTTQTLYVQGDILAGAGSTFNALYATGDVHLGSESELHDWAHADGVLRLGQNSIAVRRVSAGVAIELGNESWFERLHAPLVHFGSGVGHKPAPDEVNQKSASYADLDNAVEQTPSLFLIRGDCALQPGSIYHGSLVVTGFLTIGAGTTVMGDIKAREGLSIGPKAWVQGAVTCEKRIYVFNGGRVFGPLISETDILIGADAVIGLPDAQTTVSGANIIVENGVVVHGTLWAHEIGLVKAA